MFSVFLGVKSKIWSSVKMLLWRNFKRYGRNSTLLNSLLKLHSVMKSMKQYKTLTLVSFSTELTQHLIPKAFKNHPEHVRCYFFLPPRQGFQREIFSYLLNDVIWRRPWNISLFIFVSKSIGWNFFFFPVIYCCHNWQWHATA